MGQNIPDTLHGRLRTVVGATEKMEAAMLHSSCSKAASATKYYPEKAGRPFC